MYACIPENGGGFFAGVQVTGSATYFSRPTPTTLAFAIASCGYGDENAAAESGKGLSSKLLYKLQ
jgi:hypothetical protein